MSTSPPQEITLEYTCLPAPFGNDEYAGRLINCLTLSPDEKQLYVGYYWNVDPDHPEIEVWDVITNQRQTPIRTIHEMNIYELMIDGKKLFVNHVNDSGGLLSVRVYDVDTRLPIPVAMETQSQLQTIMEDRKLWEKRTGRVYQRRPETSMEPGWYLVSHDGQHYFSDSTPHPNKLIGGNQVKGTVQLQKTHIPTRKCLLLYPQLTNVWDYQLLESPDGQWLYALVVTYEPLMSDIAMRQLVPTSHIHVWNAHTGEYHAHHLVPEGLDPHLLDVSKISPDGRWVYALKGRYCGVPLMVDLTNGQSWKVHHNQEHNMDWMRAPQGASDAYATAVSRDGATFYVGYSCGDIACWDLQPWLDMVNTK